MRINNPIECRRIARQQMVAGTVLVAIFGTSLLLFAWLRAAVRGPDPVKRFRATLDGYQYLSPDGVIYQQGQFDCGPAAMEMILTHYGIRRSLTSLQDEMLDDPKGTTMGRMKAVAEHYGFVAETRRIGVEDLHKVPFPLIALHKRRHYVVVEKRTADGYLIILDPSLGRCKASEKSFLKACHGEVLILTMPSGNTSHG